MIFTDSASKEVQPDKMEEKSSSGEDKGGKIKKAESHSDGKEKVSMINFFSALIINRAYLGREISVTVVEDFTTRPEFANNSYFAQNKWFTKHMVAICSNLQLKK